LENAELLSAAQGLQEELDALKSKRREEKWQAKKLRAAQENRQGTLERSAAEKQQLEVELIEVKNAWQQQQADFDKLRRTLQNDLNTQVERYVALKMQVEERRSTPSKDGSTPESSKEREMIVSLQRRLDSVTSDHQWLLQQYVAINTQAGELRKKASLREEYVKQLETSMHQQTARHEDEIAKLSAEMTKMQAREMQLRDAMRNVSLDGIAPELLQSPRSPVGAAAEEGRERSSSFEEKLKSANDSFGDRISAHLNKVVAPLRGGQAQGIPQGSAVTPRSGRIVTPIKGGAGGAVPPPPPPQQDAAPISGAEEEISMHLATNIWGRMRAAFSKKPAASPP